MQRKCVLIILDGWGTSTNKESSAIDAAHTPYIDHLLTIYPHSKLNASGESVGLPKDQMGNSEVGHLTIGAGRVIKQSLLRINDSITSGEFYQNQTLLNLFNLAKKGNTQIHVIGLLSDGGVHSHISHAKAICTMAKINNITDLYMHVFTDGRDTHPGSAFHYLNDMNEHLKKTTGTITSIMGRYYPMDRDNRWERTTLAYDAMVKGIGIRAETLMDAKTKLENLSLTDEFFLPTMITKKKTPLTTIKNNDIVLSFNFRADRMRQITSALTQNSTSENHLYQIQTKYFSMTEYDPTYKNISTVFSPLDIQDTLGEVLAKNQKSQLRIAETEKYPHITYFLSGGKETMVSRETRILCPSPHTSTYDKIPEMAATDITHHLLTILEKQTEDFICVNFANADMVGHTGNFTATMKACETIDYCLSKIVPQALTHDYTILIVSDHGNADDMTTKDGTLHTSHTTNKVPCILIDAKEKFNIRDGSLADIAPTILNLMSIEKPKVMTGTSLIV